MAGKVLLDLAGCPMLERVVNRVSRSKTLGNIVIATTTQQGDDSIVDLCESHGWDHFRGSEVDVLDRYYHAASLFKADVIVRITADCPLIDPEIVDRVVNDFTSVYQDADYVSNTFIRTYPRGLDVEVISYSALAKAWKGDHDPASREHVTPYIWRQLEKFSVYNVTNDSDYSYMRWTVDTSEDLELIRRIYEHFRDDTFTWKDVLNLLELHPGWMDINRNIQQKPVQ